MNSKRTIATAAGVAGLLAYIAGAVFTANMVGNDLRHRQWRSHEAEEVKRAPRGTRKWVMLRIILAWPLNPLRWLWEAVVNEYDRWVDLYYDIRDSRKS